MCCSQEGLGLNFKQPSPLKLMRGPSGSPADTLGPQLAAMEGTQCHSVLTGPRQRSGTGRSWCRSRGRPAGRQRSSKLWTLLPPLGHFLDLMLGLHFLCVCWG
jgi:hypothetical protein